MCFFENVEGHITLGLSSVISDLEELGYKVSWGIFSAREVGAPHQRKRVFIMAHRKCEGLEGWNSRVQSESNRCRSSNKFSESSNLLGNTGYNAARTWPKSVEPKLSSSGISSYDAANTLCNGVGESRFIQQGTDGSIFVSNGKSWRTWPSRPSEPQHECEPPRVVANSVIVRQRGRDHGDETELRGEIQAAGSCACELGHSNGLDRSESPEGWEYDTKTGYPSAGQVESPLGRDADGTACGMDYAELCVSGDNRTDELRLLGNGVVPATAERAFRTLLTELDESCGVDFVCIHPGNEVGGEPASEQA
jgi:site-specific DNA-cytosine methylase